ALKGEKLPIYGDGMNIRDWLHVSDHCSAVDVVLHHGKSGEVYNIGGNNEKTNNELVQLIVDTLGVSRKQITYVQDRPGHDRRYAINNSKICTELNWRPRYTFEHGIKETIDWYLSHLDWIDKITTKTYL